MKKYFLTLSILLTLTMLSSGVAFAQTKVVVTGGTTNCADGSTPTATRGCNLGYTQLEPIPGLVASGNLVNPNNLPNIINAIFKILISVGALIAVLSLTLGGVQYMVSGSAGGKNAGLQRAQSSIWAIGLIAASWLILNTINPQLLKFSLNPCPQGVNCNVTTNASNAGGNTYAAAQITANAQDQITQNGLSGKTVDNSALLYNGNNLPSAEMRQSFSDSCGTKKGVVTAMPGGFACEKQEAYNADRTQNYTDLTNISGI